MKQSTNSSSPAVHAALGYIREALGTGIWKNGDRLPPLSALARMARVSRNTMWKAAGIARNEGLISVMRAGRIWAGPRITPNEARQKNQLIREKQTLWLRKRGAVERDIIEGLYSDTGMLPPAKELRLTYGVSAATLRKMLGSLSSHGTITRHTGSYRITLGKKKKYHNTLVVISEYAGQAGVHNERMAKIVDLLESLCARANVRVVFARLDLSGPVLSPAMQKVLGDSESVLGYIFDVPWVSPGDFWQKNSDLFHRVASHGRPIAILDFPGIITLPAAFAKREDIQVFRISNFRAGQTVGQYLLGLRHTRIAYISTLHQSAWSIERLAGMDRAFELAGRKNGVLPFVNESAGYYDNRPIVLGEVPARKIQKLLAVQSIFEPPQPELGRPRQVMDFARSAVDRIKSIQKNLSILGSMPDQRMMPEVFTIIRDESLARASMLIEDLLIEPLFERALADNGITAWALANDGMVYSALRYFQQNKIPAGKQPALVGFDNLRYTFRMKMTSYDFNLSGLVHRILWFIRHEESQSGKSRRDAIEIDGFVVERATTRR